MKRTYIFDEKLKKLVEITGNKSVNDTPLRVITMEYTSPKDGSRFEKGPMSRSYIEHIYSRNSDSVKRMKPNMGSYGA